MLRSVLVAVHFRAVRGVAAGVIALPLALTLGPVLFLGDPGTIVPPAPARLEGIPAGYLTWYVRAGQTCPEVSWNVLAAVGKVESSHGADVGRSPAGAVGPMQFMPSTWATWGKDANGDRSADPYSPADAISSGARYLCSLVKRFGSLPLALAAHNAGSAAMATAAGVPVAAAGYVDRVLAWAKRYASEAFAAMAAGNGRSVAGPGPFGVCPVRGPVTFSDDFGAPRFAGGYHPHAGNDLFAPAGTQIVAPFDGTAVDSTNTLGGLAVTVYGVDGYAYNAHLSRFGRLGRVGTGTVIGYVGNSGDAIGGPTHDHFEWHPNALPTKPHMSPYGQAVIGTAMDPYPYLREVC